MTIHTQPTALDNIKKVAFYKSVAVLLIRAQKSRFRRGWFDRPQKIKKMNCHVKDWSSCNR